MPHPMSDLRKGVNKIKSSGKTSDLVELALKLYDLGFNVIPVDSEKRPLCSWSPRKRIEESKLKELLSKASGIAVCGGFENPLKEIKSILVIFDIDDPRILEKSVFLKSLVEHTVSWKTGPRCPRCGEKHLEIIEPGRKFRCKCGLEFSIEDAQRGIGALAFVDLDVYEKYLKSTIRAGPVEILVNNYQLIPPSLHPSGVRYEWIRPFNFDLPNYGIYPLTDTELENILDELGVVKKFEEQAGEVAENNNLINAKTVEAKLRELSDSEIIKIKELLKEAYKPGARQYIWLFLSGWTAKARISPISVAKILKMLYEETGDEDSIKSRAGAIVYTYRKAGIDLTQYANDFEALFGVKPYGLGKEISEEQVKGKSGLQEILEEALGEERALAVLKELEEILQTSSPYRDSVFELLDYEKQLYAVANLRKLVMVRARLVNNKLVYKERVAVVAPTRLIVYDNPIGGIRKYQVVFEGATLRKPLTVGPALIEEIADRLRAEGLVYNSRLINDVLSAIVNAFIKRGRAEIKAEIESPGFYIVDNRLVAVNYEISDPDREKLKSALLLLNELAETWFKHAIDKFATIVKWGAVAPFSYVIKQRGRMLKWLYLYGDSATGKTTLARIVLRIWGLDSKYEKTGASIDTPARFGYVVSSSSFPIVVNEPGNALAKEDIVEMLKNSVDGTIVRGKYVRGTYVEYPALAPIIFTSNKHIPQDDALARRLYIITFSYGEKIPLEKQAEFKEKIEPRLQLSEIGKCIASQVQANMDLLDKDPIEAGAILLAKCYELAGLQPPQWLSLKYDDDSADTSSDLIVEFRERLKKYINDTFAKYISRIVEINDAEERASLINPDSLDFERKIRILLEKNALVGIRVKDNNILINRTLIEELGLSNKINLKSLAEILGWEYRKYSERIGQKVQCIAVIITTVDAFIEFMTH